MQTFVINEDGACHELCECQVCGAPIYRAGLCGVCKECFPAVEVPITEVLEPGDLRDHMGEAS
jgi:hypothetical protein